MSNLANVADLHALELRIARHFTEYVHCIDDERYEEWPDFFSEQCTYRITTRAALRRGYLAGIIDCESRGMLVDRVNSLRHANIFEPHTYRHLLGPTRIVSQATEVVAAGGAATIGARTGFVLMRTVEGQDAEVFLTGVYDDVFEDRDGDLKVAERIVVLDASRVDTLLVLPV